MPENVGGLLAIGGGSDLRSENWLRHRLIDRLSLAALEAEAARLCSHGFQVLRVSQNFARPEPDDNGGTQFLQQAGDWLSGMPGNQAQVLPPSIADRKKSRPATLFALIPRSSPSR